MKVRVDNETEEPRRLANLTDELRTAVQHADIVLVPDDGFRDYPGPVFSQGTMELFQYLREHAPAGTNVEIAVEDAEYREVAVHFNIVRLATAFVEYVAAPILMSLIAAYLKDWLGSKFATAEVRSTILVHRKDATGEQTLRYSYEGPATTYEKAMTEATASLNTVEGNDETPAKIAKPTDRPIEEKPKRQERNR
jgi:hypothetical protein